MENKKFQTSPLGGGREGSNRIEILDVYRGFAIFGIFVVNIVIMNSTFLNQDVFLEQFTGTLDVFAQRLLQLFFYTKFFPIFSLLFGIGIAMQALKLNDKNKHIGPFFARRMLFLLLFGIVHILLLWSGDVLNLYALLGFLVVFLLKFPNKWLLILAVLLLIFPFYDQILAEIFSFIGFQPEVYLAGYTGDRVNEIISNGSYLQGMHLRLLEYLTNIPMLFGFLAPVAFSMFLLGIYLGKNRIFNDFPKFLKHIKVPVLVIALLSNLYRIAFLFYLPDYQIYRDFRPFFIKTMVISDVLMGLFYLWILGMIWYFTIWGKLLKPLKYVGRMALSNYILQSVVGLFLFSSVGFGMYERFSPSCTLGIAVLVFLFQIVLSGIWLRFFRFGPLEWVWRCLTYKKIFSLKI
ncbi:DUF418 domain-containing protein [Flavimarina sp. Hel_I_48]|uniref:DUF418 domain-containing protein n=1 Tax=Flavimarina sp. Hel_I_48 TaxID=1392488 RepID=UPI00068CD554|nr:DUF418 domain-containing protein [Flavimarina sp. Hel_I_48]